MPGGTAKNFKINKYKFLKMKLIFTKDNLELQWPQWRTFNLDELVHLQNALGKKGSRTSPKQ